MNPATQVAFEAAQTGATPLAIFVPHFEPIGPSTEQRGITCANFYHNILVAAGIECSPWSLLYTAQGFLVLISVNDLKLALSEIWGVFARADAEDFCWLAEQKPDGSWSDLCPVRGAARVLPAEIPLLPRRLYQLEAELQSLRARQEELGEANRQQQADLASGRTIDALAADNGDGGVAWVQERLTAVTAEIAAWKRKATSLEAQS